MTKNGTEDVQKTVPKETEAYRKIEMAEMARVVGKRNGNVNVNGTEAANDAKIDMMNASDTAGNYRIHI